jgi:CRP-like cAMP-binding protein
MADSRLPPALVAYMRGISPLSEAFFRRFEEWLTRKEFGAREPFSRLGVVQETVGLLESGVVRAYYNSPQGGEYNKHLYFAPALIGDYTSIITGKPVVLPQQTLTPCVVWTFPFRKVAVLEGEFPELTHFRRAFAESMYLLKEQRELEIVTLSATQRYHHLLREVPDIEVLMPQYEIASYLGITASQLSRVRARPK